MENLGVEYETALADARRRRVRLQEKIQARGERNPLREYIDECIKRARSESDEATLPEMPEDEV